MGNRWPAKRKIAEGLRYLKAVIFWGGGHFDLAGARGSHPLISHKKTIGRISHLHTWGIF